MFVDWVFVILCVVASDVCGQQTYWLPGNSEGFLDLVQKLTGKPLSADAWVNKLQRPLAEVVSGRLQSWGKNVRVEFKQTMVVKTVLKPQSMYNSSFRMVPLLDYLSLIK